MSNLAELTTRFARRPLLLEPQAAAQLLQHLAASDPRVLQSEGSLNAFLRMVGLGRRPQPMAMDDADHYVAPIEPAAYAPLWAEQRYGDPTDTGYGWSLYQGVAMVEVKGALADRGEQYCGTFYHGYDTLLAALRETSADERVKGVFIRMCSPGGPATSGLPALSEFMRQNRAAAGGKPIHIYCDLSCSAGYWATSPADFISAGPMAFVGSIGAVIVHYDASEAFRQAGVTIDPIQFGSKKTDGASWKALSAAARADLQAEIDQIGQLFVADVAKSRPKLTAEALLATEAGVFMADHDDPARSALALGFIDAVETEEEAFDRLLSVVSPPASSLPAFSPPMRSAQAPQTEETSLMVKQIQPTATAGRANAPKKSPVTSSTDETAENDDDAGVGDDADETNDNGDTEEPARVEEASATAIANSPEAMAHPTQAIAAIQHGLTLAQFKGMLSAPPPAAAAGGQTAFQKHMSATRNVGADAAASAPASWGSALVANAKARKR